jgi:hypothetical protein
LAAGQPALALRNLRKVTAEVGKVASSDAVGGREQLGLVARALELGLDPETELRTAVRRYRDLVGDGEQEPGSHGT